MKSVCCLDCKQNHKCGISCQSRDCLDEQCQCSIVEIKDGLYFCKICELAIPIRNSAFEIYFQNAEKYWNAFLQNHAEYLYQLRARIYRSENLAEREDNILKTADAFYHARENIRLDKLTLPTMNSRKHAYEFIKAFEALENLKI